MKTYTVPMGRIKDFKHEYPDRTCYQAMKGHLDFDYKFTIFPSREFMKNCLKKDSTKKALVKDFVPREMIIYPNFQKSDVDIYV